MVCEAVETFPHASVAVQVLVTAYEPAQVPGAVVSAEVKVNADPQASVAVATANSGVCPQPIVDGAGNSAITGASVSLTVIVCDTDEVLLQASVKVQVLVIT